MKRTAAGAHLPTPWPLETTKRLCERADYCVDSRDCTVPLFTILFQALRLVFDSSVTEWYIGVHPGILTVDCDRTFGTVGAERLQDVRCLLERRGRFEEKNTETVNEIEDH